LSKIYYNQFLTEPSIQVLVVWNLKCPTVHHNKVGGMDHMDGIKLWNQVS